MEKAKIMLVCANCNTPIKIDWPKGYGDTMDIICPGDDPNCSPLESRALMTPDQVIDIASNEEAAYARGYVHGRLKERFNT